MRYPLYLLTIASCLLLVGLFYDRGAYVAAAIAGAAAIFYAVRLFTAGRKGAPEPASDVEGQAPSAQRAQVIARLQDRRKIFNENRAKLTLLAFCISVIGLATWFTGNPALASAISIANLPVVWLVWRNSKAIKMIDDGLRGRVPAER